MSDDHVTLPDDDDVPPADKASEDLTDDDSSPGSPANECSQCGSTLDGEQQYCLECGTPTPNAVQLRERRSAPALVAASLLALGVGGASLIYALTRDDTASQTTTTSTIPTTSTLPTFPTGTNPFPTTSTTLPPFPTATTTTPTTTPTFPSTTTTTPTGPSTPDYDIEDDWQYEFETRWTVIMQSAKTPEVAVAYCDSLRRQGVTCGVLNSSFYSSLRPGYFAVFHGAYQNQSAAQTERQSLASRFPSAYVRRVES